MCASTAGAPSAVTEIFMDDILDTLDKIPLSDLVISMLELGAAV